MYIFFFFFNDTATPEIYTLPLHDALPISPVARRPVRADPPPRLHERARARQAGRRPAPPWHAGRAGARRLLRTLRVPRGKRDGHGEFDLFPRGRRGRGSRRRRSPEWNGDDGSPFPREHAG